MYKPISSVLLNRFIPYIIMNFYDKFYTYPIFIYQQTNSNDQWKEGICDVFKAPHPSVSLYDRFYKLHKCLESLSRELDLPESVVTSKR